MRTLTPIAFIALMFTNMALALDQNNGEKSQDAERVQVAMTYIKRLSKGELDLTKHTALSRHCGPERLKELRAYVNFQRKNYFRENDLLIIETQKTHANFAGILIRVENPATPLSARVHAVALIKKENTWLPAPLPGLFSNTAYGYDDQAEQSVRSLEQWMAGEKILRESQHRNKAIPGIKARLATIEKEAGLAGMSPEQVVTFFLDQCRNNDLLGIITSMGGASDALVQPMETTLKNISAGLIQKKSDSEWYLLTRHDIVARILQFNEKSGEIAVGFYNPMESDQDDAYRILLFPTHSSEGKIFIRLPELLNISLQSKEIQKKMGLDNLRWKQRKNHKKLREKIPSAIFKSVATVNYPTPEKVLNHLLDSLKKDDFSHCLRLLSRQGDFLGKGENQKTILSDFGDLWRNLQGFKSTSGQAHHIIEEKNLALAPLSYVKTNRVNEFHTVKIWMLKSADGWHLISQGTLDTSLSDTLKPTADKMEKILAPLEKKHRDEYARNFLSNVVTITPPLNVNAPTEKDARSMFESFRNHLRKRNTQAALSSCAILKGTSYAQVIKTLNYALRGAADHTDRDHILDTTQKGHWLGISVRTESKLSGTNDYPLYLVANTSRGARIMIDIDLRHASNKGRKFLNTRNWNHLEQILAKDSVDALKAIFEQHIKLSNKDIEKISQTQD